MRFLDLLCLISPVLAHGGVRFWDLDGVRHEAYRRWDPPDSQVSIGRKWTFEYVDNLNSTFMRCGNDGTPTHPSAYGSVTAGSIVTAGWHNNSYHPDAAYNCNNAGPDCLYHYWFHFTGPIFAYMAKCHGPCEKFEGDGKVWFKIAQAGLAPNASIWSTDGSGGWIQDQLELHGVRKGWDFRIPKSLEPGNYLLRVEILNNAGWSDPQFYPNCAQISVRGHGHKRPGHKHLVSIPGLYNEEDPGVNMGNWYLSEDFDEFVYPFPGPPVWTG